MPARLLAFAVLALLAAPAAGDDPSFNGKPASEWLAMLKSDGVPRKRKAAALALGQIVADNPDARAAIVPAVARAVRNDTNPGVRAQAAAVLGQQPADKAELFMLDLTEALRIEKDSDVRREIAGTLGRLGKPAATAVKPLAEVLKDPRPATRAAAADALGRLGKDARETAPQVLPLAADADRGVRLAVAFALGRLDPDDPEPAAAALVNLLTSEAKNAEKRDAELCRAAVVSLGLLGEKSAEVITAVAGRLDDAEAGVRQDAAIALGRLAPASGSAEPRLSKAFREDADKLVRTYALSTLCSALAAEPQTLVPLLTGRLKGEPEYEVRVAIAEGLGALGPAGKDALPALRDAQRDPQVKVREASAAAIRRIQKPAEKKP